MLLMSSCLSDGHLASAVTDILAGGVAWVLSLPFAKSKKKLVTAQGNMREVRTPPGKVGS